MFCNFSASGFTDLNMNLGINSGILIVVPIPKEYSASGNPNESAIQNALKEEW